MTEKRWQHLDHRELPDGSTVVFHWPFGVERFCADSYRPIHPGAGQCRDHPAATSPPCEAWSRQPPECGHAQVEFDLGAGDRARPTCVECGLVGEDVTAEMGA